MNNQVVVNAEVLEFWGVKNDDNKRMLRFLITSKEELKEFMSSFYDGRILKNMVTYRQHKRDTYEMSEEEFVVAYSTNKKRALERTFQQPITKKEINLIAYYNLTYADIYASNNQYPGRTFVQVVTGQVPVKSNSDELLLM